MKTPVIVTSLLDIGRDTWKAYNVSYHTYLWWMKHTLSIDSNIVIYTDERFYTQILNIRKEFDPHMHKTKLIQCKVERLPSYLKYHKKLEILMYSNEFKKKILYPVPEMNQPLYNTIIFNKLNFIKDAKDNQYFNGDLYLWVDAGGLRDDKVTYKNKVWPNLVQVNKLVDPTKVSFFSHSLDFTINNNEEHALSQYRYIQGGSFLCPLNTIDSLHQEFNCTVDDCIRNDYIGSEEKMLDITYLKNKKLYNLLHSDWRGYYDMLK